MTELATIEEVEGELVGELLTKAEAKKLDTKIRNASDRLTNNINKVEVDAEALLELIQEAQRGQIHKALGLASWTAWFKDAVQIDPTSRLERKEMVKLMSGQGFSSRAIAGTLGISQSTANRDAAESADSGETEGLDGKTYKRGPVVDPEPEPLEAETVEPEEEPAEMKAVDIVAEFDVETANLYNAMAAMHDLGLEAQWPKAIKRIAKADLNMLGDVIKGVQEIIDVLMEA